MAKRPYVPLKPLQTPMNFSPETDWVVPNLLGLDLSSAKEIAIDLETRDPNLIKLGSGAIFGDGEVVGIAVAVDGWKAYLPFAHEGGKGCLGKKTVLKWFQTVLDLPADKIFHNAMYDVSWIRAMGLKINGRIIDTMIAASLIDENRFRYSLDSVAKDYAGIRKNEAVLREAAKEWGVDPKAEMWRLPAPFVGEYAERDAEATLKLWHVLKVKLDEEQLWNVFNLETDLFPCLVDMKFKGVRVDLEKTADVKKLLLKEEKETRAKMEKLAEAEVEIWSAASIAKAFEKLNIPFDRTEKGAPSFTKNFLATHPHDFPKMVVTCRELDKMNSTFIETILKREHNGRIHADINQIRSDQGGTVTGRFSYSNPNLQQIPARHKILGPMLRSLFIPEEKHTWGCFDYSQQEPRILVHYAHKMNMEGASTIVEAYNKGEADFHQMIADMAGIDRKQAKTINLGIMYGMGKNKLMSELGLMKEDAEGLLKEYHRNAPFIKMISERVMRQAEEVGKIRTLEGRSCHFNLWQPDEFGVSTPLPLEDAKKEYGQFLKRAFTYKALNKLIQGSAADMTKRAMLNLYKEGVIPHIQVHDELDISVESPEHAKKIIEVMEASADLCVPNKVDYEKGPNWGEIVSDAKKEKK